VIISNFVINLAADKRGSCAKHPRSQRAGGLPCRTWWSGNSGAAVRRSMELWVGCVAGALEEVEYQRLLAEAGFDGIGCGSPLGSTRRGADQIMGAFVRARKRATNRFPVLFLCTGNSARSRWPRPAQLKGRERFTPRAPARAPPIAVNPHGSRRWRVQRALARPRPSRIDGLERESWDCVSRCCDERRSRARLSRQPIMAHWGMPTPPMSRATKPATPRR